MELLLGMLLVYGLAVGLVLFVTCGLPAAFLAEQRGRSQLNWALLGIFLGPVAILVVGLSEREPYGRFEECPDCGEAVFREARRCSHCRALLGD